MKTKKIDQDGSFTAPLLETTVAQDKANFAANFPAPSVSAKPLDPPDLYQDAGGGYNANFTYPQE